MLSCDWSSDVCSSDLILKVDSNFDLATSEAGHPTWGPVWRSIKGAHNDHLILVHAGSAEASPAQHKMADGVREYEAGRYKEAIDALEAALKSGLPTRSEEILARKYAAFAYCLSQRNSQCRVEFHVIFTLDASFELLPSEASHPAWSDIYRKEQAAAKRVKK